MQSNSSRRARTITINKSLALSTGPSQAPKVFVFPLEPHSHPPSSRISFSSATTDPAALFIALTSTALIFLNTNRVTSSLSLLSGLPIPTPILINPFSPNADMQLFRPLCPLALPPVFILVFPKGLSSSSCSTTRRAALRSSSEDRERRKIRHAAARGGPLTFMSEGDCQSVNAAPAETSALPKRRERPKGGYESSEAREVRRVCPAEWSVLRYGLGLPSDATKIGRRAMYQWKGLEVGEIIGKYRSFEKWARMRKRRQCVDRRPSFEHLFI